MAKKSCHKCAGTLGKAHESTVAHCSICHAGYHTIDCGMRYLAAGLDESLVLECPKCLKMCACSGGGIPCHTANVRLRGAARKKRQLERSSSDELYDCNNSATTSCGERSSGAGPAGAAITGAKIEPKCEKMGTFLIQNVSNKRFKQKTKVPIVVGQLILANRALRDEVKQLQAVLSECRCFLSASSDSDDISPKTPPAASELVDGDGADSGEWDGLFITDVPILPDGEQEEHGHQEVDQRGYLPPAMPEYHHMESKLDIAYRR